MFWNQWSDLIRCLGENKFTKDREKSNNMSRCFFSSQETSKNIRQVDLQNRPSRRKVPKPQGIERSWPYSVRLLIWNKVTCSNRAERVRWAGVECVPCLSLVSHLFSRLKCVAVVLKYAVATEQAFDGVSVLPPRRLEQRALLRAS